MKKKSKIPPFVTWEEAKSEHFKKHPEDIYNYLRSSIEENSDLPEAIISAIRTALDALDISLEELAKKAKMQPSTVYKALGKKGNPTVQTLTAILGALGLRLSLEKKVG